MRLHSGFIISPHRHYAGSWQPASRLSLNEGILCLNESFFPREDWRILSDAELAVLTCADSHQSLELRLQVFTIPNRLYRAFWELDLDHIAASSGLVNGTLTSSEPFTEQLADFLRFIDAPLARRCSFRMIITAQGLPSTTYDPVERRYLGLRLAPHSGLPRSLCSAEINFGEEPRAVVCVNLPPESMLELLLTSGRMPDLPAMPAAEATATAFMSASPDYPVIRLRLDPGEGYFAPLHRLVHDGYTRDMAGPDFNLVVEPVALQEPPQMS
jgi:hypothetical protein